MAIRECQVDRKTIRVPFPASTANDAGDLLYWDNSAKFGKKASARTDAGTAALNQADFAPLFLGIAGDQRLVTETSVTVVATAPLGPSDRTVVTEGVFDCDCASATWEVGDLIGIARDSGNSVNFNQKVVKVTDPRLAIGQCIKREPTAVTRVKGWLSAYKYGWFAAVGSLSDVLTIGASTAAAGSSTSDATALPAGTARVYPTTAADDAKGVKITVSDQITGRQLFIGNGVSNKILLVYGPTGAVINGAAANAGFSSASGKGVIAVCLSGSGNTWLMF